MSGEVGFTAEITTALPVCIEQSLNSSRALEKLNAKQSFTTTWPAKSTDRLKRLDVDVAFIEQ